MRASSLYRLLVTVTLVALFGASRSVSADAPADYKAWEKHGKKINAKLQKQDWAGAHEDAREAVADALADPAGRIFLASMVGRLAVAEAGLGRREDALWHWQTSLNLSSLPLSDKILVTFGPPGELLISQPERRRLDEAPAGLEVQPVGAPGVEPAKKVAGDLPAPSKALQAISVPKWLRLQAVIDAEGRLRDPVVVTAVPEMTWEVLEAARSWRFEPGRKDGVPVATFYELVVNAPAEKPLTELIDLHPDLAALEALLRAGRWQEASTKGEQTWLHAINWGEASRGYFAVALMFRALAAAATGAKDVAICQWQGAQALVRPWSPPCSTWTSRPMEHGHRRDRCAAGPLDPPMDRGLEGAGGRRPRRRLPLAVPARHVWRPAGGGPLFADGEFPEHGCPRRCEAGAGPRPAEPASERGGPAATGEAAAVAPIPPPRPVDRLQTAKWISTR